MHFNKNNPRNLKFNQTTNILKLCFIINSTKSRKIIKKIYLNDNHILKLTKQLSMKNNSKTDLQIIDEMQQIRAHNNINWMELIKLAFKHAPEEAKTIMTSINTDDAKITALLEKLSTNE